MSPFRHGDHYCIAYSKCALTYPLYMIGNPFLVMHLNCLLTIPNILLASDAACVTVLH